MQSHVKILAVLYLVFGFLGICGALAVIVVFAGGAGVASLIATDEPEVWLAVPIIGAVGVALAIFLLALSLPGIVAGLGIYGLWVLLSGDTEQLFGLPARGE